MEIEDVLRLKHDLEGKYNALYANGKNTTALTKLLEIINKMLNVRVERAFSIEEDNFLIKAINLSFLSPVRANHMAQNLLEDSLEIMHELGERTQHPQHASQYSFISILKGIFSCFTITSSDMENSFESKGYIYRVGRVGTDEMSYYGDISNRYPEDLDPDTIT